MNYHKSNFFNLLSRIILSIFLLIPYKADSDENSKKIDIHRRELEYFYRQMSYPFKKIPPGAMSRAFKAIKKAKKLKGIQAEVATEEKWEQIGPSPIKGASYDQIGDVNGRVNAIVIHPNDSNIIYIGTSMGGVWKSVDRGINWTPLSDYECSLSIGSLVIDPVNPNIIYAGTGLRGYGCGVLKSTNGGITWTQLGASVFDIQTGGAKIYKTIVDPVNTSTLYVASNYGFYKSVDGGENFTLLRSGDASDLVMDPISPSVLYAGFRKEGIFKSTDSGTTWTQLTSGLPVTGFKRINLAIAPSSPQTLYSGFENPANGGLAGIFKTTDNGANWTKLSPSPLGSLPDCSPQCWWNMLLLVDPDNANIVYFGGVNLYKSIDGGMSWSDITRGKDYYRIHVDQQALVIDSLGRLYVGNDGGIWYTEDMGDHWHSLNKNLSTVNFNTGVSLYSSDTLIITGGTWDNGVVKYSGSLAWDTVIYGDGGYTAIDFTNPNTIYTGKQWEGGECFFRSDYGGTKLNIGKMKGIDLNDRAEFLPPFAMDPSNSNTLVFGTHRVYRTTDKAENWTAISGDLSNGNSVGYLKTLAIAPSSSEAIYAGTSDAKVWVTTDTGKNWTNISTGLPNRYVMDIVIDPFDSKKAYVVFAGFLSKHVFYTTDAGTTWTDISSNLPDIPANALAIDYKTTPYTLYLGTNLGVFKSVENGASWYQMDNGMPNVVVTDLIIDKNTDALFAATHGRSMFRLNLNTATTTTTTTSTTITTTTTTIITAKQPDLTVKNVICPKFVKNGKRVNVKVIVNNAGKANSPASTAGFYLSATNSKSIEEGDMLLGEKSVKRINRKGSNIAVFKWEVNQKPGNYYIKAFCDIENAVIESDEGNNIGISEKVTIR